MKTNMKKFEAVLFDLDDTLYPEVDYVKSGFKVVANFLSEKINLKEKDIYNSFIHLFKVKKENVFNRFFDLINCKNEELLHICIKIYREHFPNISLANEVMNVLEYLKMKKYKLGIITDGRSEGQRNKIKALDLQKYFDYILITDELGGIKFRKPNKLSYIKILNELNVTPVKSVYIGDNPKKDFITAKKLGIYTIMVENNNSIYSQKDFPVEYLADISVKKIEELKDIL